MKDCTIEIEVVTHILANGMTQEGERDCFQRSSAECLIFQQAWFFSAFTQAIDLARVKGIKAADIHMDLIVRAPTAMYRRRYGDDHYRIHEAIMPGSIVKFEAVVADHVTESSLRLILEKMGKYVGLSPYGWKLGYGKFSVVSCHVADSASGELDDNKSESDRA